jgi:hypothetical protein
MKTIGEFIAERRKALGLSQKKMAARIKNRDGKPLSMPYLSYLEKWPRRAARVPARSVCQGTACRTRGVVFLDPPHATRRHVGEGEPEHVTVAYRAFRRELKGRGGRSGGKKR